MNSDLSSANPNYRSFLLRLWRVDPDAPWRASLVSPHGGETISFATLEGLKHFLDELGVAERRASETPHPRQVAHNKDKKIP